MVVMCLYSERTSGSTAAITEKQKRDLIQFLDIDFGLLDHLLALEVLSTSEFEMLKEIRPYSARAEQLLELVSKLDRQSDQFRNFMEALSQSDQAHVINYLTNQTEGKLSYQKEKEKSLYLTSKHVDIVAVA